MWRFIVNLLATVGILTLLGIGGCVAFLCSPAADQVTGTTLSVDGGWTAL